ncbi:MAG TPA: hypothetical protein VKX17_18870 [Planctomycetota bacterium]|nr:hypothetical protein [Planctomycetota bacterium]
MDTQPSDEPEEEWSTFINDPEDDYIPTDEDRRDRWMKNFIKVVGANPKGYGVSEESIRAIKEAHNKWLIDCEFVRRAAAALEQGKQNVELFRPLPQQTRNETMGLVAAPINPVSVSASLTDNPYQYVGPPMPERPTTVVPTVLENIEGYMTRMRREHPEQPPWLTSAPVILRIEELRSAEQILVMADFHTQPEFKLPAPGCWIEIAFKFDDPEPLTGVNCITPGSTNSSTRVVSHLKRDIGKTIWYILRWRGPNWERGIWGRAYRTVVPGPK